MKFLFNLILFGVMLSSCHYAEDDESDAPVVLTKTWRLTQKVYDGNIVIANGTQYTLLVMNADSTFIKTEYSTAGNSATHGTYTLSGNQLSMVSTDTTVVAELVHLSSNALALQLRYDIDNDGEHESVRESYQMQ